MIKWLFLLLCLQGVFAQTLLKGKVIADGNPDGIMVVNYTTKKTTVTQNGGFFEIEAKINDKLVVTSETIHGVEIKVDKYSFEKEIVYVKVQSKGNQLDEVYIKAINAKSLGIISENTKTYTSAERKLRTAGKLKWYSPLLIPFGGMSVDGLINQISGRTTMLKKELKVERQEMLIANLDAMFVESFYVENLKIPSQYIKGFQRYCIDYPKLMEAVKANNRFLAVFLIEDIATQYKTLILSNNNQKQE